jgi:hypothetical protein
MNQGTEYAQYCMDCLTGNTLALKNCGSSLDPTKYPACHYDIDRPGCNDQGLFPDGSSCDCYRCNILGFESIGYSHDVAVKVMAVLESCDEGCYEPLRTLVNLIDQTRDRLGLIGPEESAGIAKLLEEHPEAVQMALDHNWIRVFL